MEVVIVYNKLYDDYSHNDDPIYDLNWFIAKVLTKGATVRFQVVEE